MTSQEQERVSLATTYRKSIEEEAERNRTANEDKMKGSMLLSAINSRIMMPSMMSMGKQPYESIALKEEPPVVDPFLGHLTNSSGSSIHEEIVKPILSGSPVSSYHNRALDEWRMVLNLDVFLDSAYRYYRGKGLQVLLVSSLANWISLGFLVYFSFLLYHCIDWRLLFKAKPPLSLWSVLRLRWIFFVPWSILIPLTLFTFVWIWQFNSIMAQVSEWRRMQRFYTHLLGLTDQVLGTCDFSEVTERIAALQSSYPISADRLTAHDIANRLMRRHNYMIALASKGYLDSDGVLKVQMSRFLEWNLTRCVFGLVFDARLQVRKTVTHPENRERLCRELKNRFAFASMLNLVLMPLTLAFTILYLAYRHGEELYRDPRAVSHRQYTQMALWKMREYNEMEHYFQERISRSHRKATKYLEQFHDERVLSLARMTSFILGACVIVLIVIGLLRSDLLTNFELTPGRSALWYIGIFSVLIAGCRSALPDDLRRDDPARLMQQLIQYTHYDPPHWQAKYGTSHVHSEFASMYRLRIVGLLSEMLGIVTAPLILWYMRSRSQAIIDFFRETTIHVEGVGLVCSCAVFEGARLRPAEIQNDPKMKQSMINFAGRHPDWKREYVGEEGAVVGSDVDGDSQANTEEMLENFEERAAKLERLHLKRTTH